MLRDRSERSVLGTTARTALLLALLFLTSWAAISLTTAESLVAIAWPASGLSVGVLLGAPRRQRPVLLGVIFALVLLAGVVEGVDPVASAAFGATCVLETVLVLWRLEQGGDGRRPALLDDGDVSRMVGAIALGCGVTAGGFALTDWVTGHGTPLLGAIAVFGTHAASLMVLLPLFLRTPDFPPLAVGRERATQAVLALGTTVVIFLSADAPPAVFVVMPMFAWLGFRGTLREATVVLTAVGLVSTALTALRLGPVWGLGARYHLSDELVIGFLQLFLLDCGLILLPLSVAVAQQRLAAAQAATGREILDRLVASATGTSIVVTDLAGRVVVFNPGAEQVLGHTAEEMLGETLERFHLHDEHDDRPADVGVGFADTCRSVVASGEPRRLWRFTRGDGETRTLLMTIAEVPDSRGARTGYLCTAEDVTEREQAQAALVQALAHQETAVGRLRDLDRIKTDVVSTVSHELRTPITSIVGFVELLEDGEAGDLTPPQRDLVSRVNRNSRRLLTLIDDLLTLSQVESTDLRSEPVPCDLGRVVAAAHEAVSSTLSQRRLDVSLSVPGEPVDFHGDPAQLERLTLNLLTNAVKFTPDGGRVDVVLTACPGVAELVVSDSGIGIPEHEQDAVFSRFFRAASATERAIQGTGLGLSIVQSIATLHGGQVALRSAVGEGTTVTVTLPRQLDETTSSGRPTHDVTVLYKGVSPMLTGSEEV